MLVLHHAKYKEIHGVDETVWMERGEHNKLHKKLRKDGKCKIATKDLRKISLAARKRTDIDKQNQIKYRKEVYYYFRFTQKVQRGWWIDEQIRYNTNSGNVGCACYFFSRPVKERVKQ